MQNMSFPDFNHRNPVTGWLVILTKRMRFRAWTSGNSLFPISSLCLNHSLDGIKIQQVGNLISSKASEIKPILHRLQTDQSKAIYLVYEVTNSMIKPEQTEFSQCKLREPTELLLTDHMASTAVLTTRGNSLDAAVVWTRLLTSAFSFQTWMILRFASGKCGNNDCSLPWTPRLGDLMVNLATETFSLRGRSAENSQIFWKIILYLTTQFFWTHLDSRFLSAFRGV